MYARARTEQRLTRACVRPDIVASGSRDGAVCVWDLRLPDTQRRVLRFVKPGLAHRRRLGKLPLVRDSRDSVTCVTFLHASPHALVATYAPSGYARRHMPPRRDAPRAH